MIIVGFLKGNLLDLCGYIKKYSTFWLVDNFTTKMRIKQIESLRNLSIALQKNDDFTSVILVLGHQTQISEYNFCVKYL